jgi:hypothetical protein
VGNQGPSGDIGATGGQGVQSLKGFDGPAGPQGLPGIKGDVGGQGDVGPRGDQGPTGLIGPQGPPGTWISQPVVDPVYSSTIDLIPKSKKAAGSNFSGLESAINDLRITGWDTTANIAFSAAGAIPLTGNLWSLQAGSRGDQLQPLKIQGVKIFDTAQHTSSSPTVFSSGPLLMSPISTFSGFTLPSYTVEDNALSKINVTPGQTLNDSLRYAVFSEGSFPLAFPSTATLGVAQSLFIPTTKPLAPQINALSSYTLATQFQITGMMVLRSDQTRLVFQDVEFMFTPTTVAGAPVGFNFQNVHVEFINCNFVVAGIASAANTELQMNVSGNSAVTVRGGFVDCRNPSPLNRRVVANDVMWSNVVFLGNTTAFNAAMKNNFSGLLNECLFLNHFNIATIPSNKKLVMQNCVVQSSNFQITAEFGSTIECLKGMYIEPMVIFFNPFFNAAQGGMILLKCTNLMLANAIATICSATDPQSRIDVHCVPKRTWSTGLSTANIPMFSATNMAQLNWMTTTPMYISQPSNNAGVTMKPIYSCTNGSTGTWKGPIVCSSTLNLDYCILVDKGSKLTLLTGNLNFLNTITTALNWGLISISNGSTLTIDTPTPLSDVLTSNIIVDTESTLVTNMLNMSGPMISVVNRSRLVATQGLNILTSPVANTATILASLNITNKSEVTITGNDLSTTQGIIVDLQSKLYVSKNINFAQLVSTTPVTRFGVSVSNGSLLSVQQNLVGSKVFYLCLSVQQDSEMYVKGNVLIKGDFGSLPTTTVVNTAKWLTGSNSQCVVDGDVEFEPQPQKSMHMAVYDGSKVLIKGGWKGIECQDNPIAVTRFSELYIGKNLDVSGGGYSAVRTSISSAVWLPSLSLLISGCLVYEHSKLFVGGDFICMPSMKWTGTAWTTIKSSGFPLLIQHQGLAEINGAVKIKNIPSYAGISLSRNSHLILKSHTRASFIQNCGSAGMEILSGSQITLQNGKLAPLLLTANGRAPAASALSSTDGIIATQNSVLHMLEPANCLTPTSNALRFDASQKTFVSLTPGLTSVTMISAWIKTPGPALYENATAVSVSGLVLTLAFPLLRSFPAGTRLMNTDPATGFTSTVCFLPNAVSAGDVTLTLASAADLATLALPVFPCPLHLSFVRSPENVRPEMIIAGSNDSTVKVCFGVDRKRLCVSVATAGDTSTRVFRGKKVVADNQWHFVCFFVNLATAGAYFFVDGMLDSAYLSWTSATFGTNAALTFNTLGTCMGTADGGYFHGLLSEVRFENQASLSGSTWTQFFTDCFYAAVPRTTLATNIFVLDLESAVAEGDNLEWSLDKNQTTSWNSNNLLNFSLVNFELTRGSSTNIVKGPPQVVSLSPQIRRVPVALRCSPTALLSPVSSTLEPPGRTHGSVLSFWMKSPGPPTAQTLSIASLTSTTLTLTSGLIKALSLNSLVLHPTERDTFTTLTAAALISATVLNVASTAGFSVGMSIYLCGPPPNNPLFGGSNSEMAIALLPIVNFFGVNIVRRRLSFLVTSTNNQLTTGLTLINTFLGNTIVTDDQWHWVTIVYGVADTTSTLAGNNNMIKYYVDGKLDATFALSTPLLVENPTNTFARVFPISGFNGSITELKFEMINSVYNGGIMPTDEMIFDDYWSFLSAGSPRAPRNPFGMFHYNFNQAPNRGTIIPEGNNTAFNFIHSQVFYTTGGDALTNLNSAYFVITDTGATPLTPSSVTNYVSTNNFDKTLHTALALDGKRTLISLPTFTAADMTFQCWIKTPGMFSTEHVVVGLVSDKIILISETVPSAFASPLIVGTDKGFTRASFTGNQLMLDNAIPELKINTVVRLSNVAPLMEICNGFGVQNRKLSFNGQLGTKIVADDMWHHVGVVKSGTTATLFVDGQVDAIVNAGAWVIDKLGAGFKGSLDEVRIEYSAATNLAKEFSEQSQVGITKSVVPVPARPNLFRYSFDVPGVFPLGNNTAFTVCICSTDATKNGTLVNFGLGPDNDEANYVEGYIFSRPFAANTPKNSLFANPNLNQFLKGPARRALISRNRNAGAGIRLRTGSKVIATEGCTLSGDLNEDIIMGSSMGQPQMWTSNFVVDKMITVTTTLASNGNVGNTVLNIKGNVPSELQAGDTILVHLASQVLTLKVASKTTGTLKLSDIASNLSVTVYATTTTVAVTLVTLTQPLTQKIDLGTIVTFPDYPLWENCVYEKK